MIAQRYAVENRRFAIGIGPTVVRGSSKEAILVCTKRQRRVLRSTLHGLTIGKGNRVVRNGTKIVFALCRLRGRLSGVNRKCGLGRVGRTVRIYHNTALRYVDSSNRTFVDSDFFPVIKLAAENRFHGGNKGTEYCIRFGPLMGRSVVGLSFHRCGCGVKVRVHSPLTQCVCGQVDRC